MVRANAARIWDIGDAEYPLVADFVNELPMDQLAEIELNSPVSRTNRLHIPIAHRVSLPWSDGFQMSDTPGIWC